MAHKITFALFAVMLAASAAQAASIGGGTQGAGEGFSDELQQGLDKIYYVIQELVAEIRTNGTDLAPVAKAYIWAQLDKLEDMWRNTSAEVHAQMPQQMLVVADAAKTYAEDVKNEEQWLTPEAKERAESLVAKLDELAAAMEAGSQAVAAAIQAQSTDQPISTTQQPTPTADPTLSTDQPVSTTQQPTPTADPTLSTDQPVSTTQQPTPTADPTLRTDQPVSTTQQPTPTADPTLSTDQPVSTTQQPTPTADPTLSTDQPVSTTQKSIPSTTQKSGSGGLSGIGKLKSAISKLLPSHLLN